MSDRRRRCLRQAAGISRTESAAKTLRVAVHRGGLGSPASDRPGCERGAGIGGAEPGGVSVATGPGDFKGCDMCSKVASATDSFQPSGKRIFVGSLGAEAQILARQQHLTFAVTAASTQYPANPQPTRRLSRWATVE